MALIKFMKNTKKIPLYLIFISLIVAIFSHLYLNNHYYSVRIGQAGDEGICNISSQLNCDLTSSSAYADFLGIPMATWGLSTNSLLLILSLLAALKISARYREMIKYSYYLSVFVFLVSIVMAYLSGVVLKVYCPFCMLTYAMSVLTLIGYHLWAKQETSRQPIDDLKNVFTKERWFLLSLIAVPLSAYVIHDIKSSQTGHKEIASHVEDAYYQWATSSPFVFSEQGLIKGPADAKMVVVEFADFLCPHCKTTAPRLKKFYESHKDVRFIFKPYPLDGECNPSERLPKFNGIRCLLSKAALCAEQVGQKGWQIHDEIFDHQEEFISLLIAENKLKEFYAKHGLNSDNMKSCVEDSNSHALLMNIGREGVNALIQGTPSIFVNGRFLGLSETTLVLEKIYEELKKR